MVLHKDFIDTSLDFLPSDWNVTTLGDVLREVNIRVKDFSTADASQFPVLSLTKNNGLMLQSERFNKRIATKDVNNYKVVTRGQIVYNPYVIWEGAIHILRNFDYGLVSPAYPVLSAKSEKADAYFLDELLRTPLAIRAYNRFSAGAVNRRRAISKRDFRTIQIPLPPLPEQHAIAKVLSTVREAIEAAERVIVAARDLKRSLLKHLFTYGPVPIDQTSQVDLIEIETGTYPNHWMKGRFDDFAMLQRGFDITKQEQKSGNVPVVSSSGIRSFHNTARVQAPGVVIGRKGSLGTVHYIEQDYWPHDTTLWVRDFKGNYPKYLFYFLPTLRLENLDTGTSNPTLNRNYVHALKIAVPPLEKQRQIVSMIEPVEFKIESENRRKKMLISLFDSLLHHLMTGKLRVPASDAFLSKIEI